MATSEIETDTIGTPSSHWQAALSASSLLGALDCAFRTGLLSAYLLRTIIFCALSIAYIVLPSLYLHNLLVSLICYMQIIY